MGAREKKPLARAVATFVSTTAAALTIALVAATFLFAGCGDASETVATNASTRAGGSGDRLETVEEWGIEFRVADSLPERSPVLDYSKGEAVAEILMFSSSATIAEPLALLSLGRTRWSGGDSLDALSRSMAHPERVLGQQYVSWIGRDGRLTVAVAPTTTTLGPGWPGVVAEYAGRAAGGSLGELGIDDLHMKLVYFRRGEYLMSCTLIVAPTGDFEAWRHVVELTLDTMAPAR